MATDLAEVDIAHLTEDEARAILREYEGRVIKDAYARFVLSRIMANMMSEKLDEDTLRRFYVDQMATMLECDGALEAEIRLDLKDNPVYEDEDEEV